MICSRDSFLLRFTGDNRPNEFGQPRTHNTLDAALVHRKGRISALPSFRRRYMPCPQLDVQPSGVAFQSTRPYGARPSSRSNNSPKTSFNPRARTGRDVSLRMQTALLCGFNPRARTGRDRLAAHRRYSGPCFNPRARTGRDQKSIGDMKCKTAFQSTRPYGARLDNVVGMTDLNGFQSTRPYGARHPLPLELQQRLHVSIHAPVRGATSLIRA